MFLFLHLIDFNKELLDKSTNLLKREHYIYKRPIIDLHFEDLKELCTLSKVRFISQSIQTKLLDNYGRLTLDGIFYYLNPSYAYMEVQLKITPDRIDIYH